MKKKLLLELARHLEDGKLGHKKFDFSQYNGTGNKLVPYKCGTAGCAIGELPILFPNKWRFNEDGDPVLKRGNPDNWRDTVDDVEIFFGLTEEESSHLFYPDQQQTDKFGGFYLDRDATRNQVASNIRNFITMKEKKNGS